MTTRSAKKISLLRAPEGKDLLIIDFTSKQSIPDRWIAFLETSPELTAYNSPDYLQWAAAENGEAFLACLQQDGHPLCAIPLHPTKFGAWTTGYSGVLFGAADTEGQLRRGVKAFVEFLNVNRDCSLEVLQINDRGKDLTGARYHLVASIMQECSRAKVQPCFTRHLHLPNLGRSQSEFESIDEDPWFSSVASLFDTKIRSQIRKALRDGLRTRTYVLSNPNDRGEFLPQFHSLHRQNWIDTGLRPHDMSYVNSLSTSVTSSGATDIGILVHQSDIAVAAVNIHVFGTYALYWAGASTSEGKRLNANPLALLAGFASAADHGAEFIELGRFYPSEKSDKELAITKYKSQFGGEISPLTHIKFDSASTSLKMYLRAKLVSVAKRLVRK